MDLELRMSADLLAANLRARLRGMPAPIVQDLPYDGQTYLVDHLEVPELTRFVRDTNDIVMVTRLGDPAPDSISVPMVDLLQDVTVVLTSRSLLDATTRGEAPALASPSRITFRLRFSVRASAAGGDLRLVVAFRDVGPGDFWSRQIPADQFDTVRAALRGAISPVSMTPDLRALDEILGGRRVQNAGLAINPELDRLALAIQLDRALSDVPGGFSLDNVRRYNDDARGEWASFYFRGGVSPVRREEWDLFVSEDVLVRSTRRMVDGGLAGNADFRATQPARVTWDPGHPAGPSIRVHVEGWTTPPGCPCDVLAYADTVISFNAAPRNTLQLRVRVDWAPNYWHVTFCCALPLAFLPGLAFLVAISPRVQAPWWSVPLALVAPALARLILVEALAAGASPGALPLPPSCRRVDEHNDHDYLCEQSLTFGGGAGLPALTLSGTFGIGEGLLVGGSIDAPPALTPAAADVTGFEAALEWVDRATCLRSGEPDLHALGSVRLRNRGETPLFISGVRAVDPAYQPYIRWPSGPISRLSAGATIQVDVPLAALDAVAARTVDGSLPPCDVLILTTGGARLVRIAAPQLPTAEERANSGDALRRRCEVERRLFVERGDLMLRSVFPEPPPDELGWTAHVWHAAVRGLPAGKSVAIAVADSGVLAQASADARGFAHLSALVRPDAAGSLVRLSAAGAGEKLEFDAGVATVSLRGSLGLPAPSTSLDVGVDRLVVATADGVAVVGIEAGTPTPRAWLDGAGVRSALALPDGVLIAGAHGLVVRRDADTKRIHAEPAGALARLGTVVVAALPDKLIVLDGALDVVDELDLDGVEHLVPADKRLLAVGAGRAQLLGLDEASRLKPLAGRTVSRDVLAARSAREALGTDAAVLVTKSGGEVIDLARDGLDVIATYAEEPWFARATLLGSEAAVLSVDRSTLAWCELDAFFTPWKPVTDDSATLPPEPPPSFP